MIHWSYLPPSRKRAGKAGRAPVLVASGALTVHAAGSAVLKIHLTAAGRRLLRGSGRLRLTATCVFTPAGATAAEDVGDVRAEPLSRVSPQDAFAEHRGMAQQTRARGRRGGIEGLLPLQKVLQMRPKAPKNPLFATF